MGLFNDQDVYVEAVPDFALHSSQRFTDRQEPYVRARVQRRDGAWETVDAKATFWTRTHVNIDWMVRGRGFSFWVPVNQVERIRRCDSSWRDPYDDPDAYPEGEY